MNLLGGAGNYFLAHQYAGGVDSGILKVSLRSWREQIFSRRQVSRW